jgi:hypothetical protein
LASKLSCIFSKQEAELEARKPLSDFADTDKRLRLLGTIWTKPTTTLRFILANCPDKYVNALLALGGIARAVERAASQHNNDYLALARVSPLSLVFGALSGWLTYYVYGWALSVVGRWLGGTADSEKTRTVLAWALVPAIAGLGMVTLYVVLFNNEWFTITPAAAPTLRKYLEIILLVVQGIGSVWAVVIMTKGLQLIQSFSPGRALVNMVLPGTVLIAIIMLMAGIYELL